MSLTPLNNLSAVSLTPVNSFSAVSLTLAKNFRLFGYFPVTRINTGDTFFASVIDTTEQFIAGVNYTGDKYSFANISANFRKKLKLPQLEHLGAWGTLILEKHLKSKISCQTPFKLMKKVKIQKKLF